MVSIFLITITGILSFYYVLKLRKIDKVRAEAIGSIIIAAVILNILPIPDEIGGFLVIAIFSLVIGLCRRQLKGIEVKKKEEFYKFDKTDRH